MNWQLRFLCDGCTHQHFGHNLLHPHHASTSYPQLAKLSGKASAAASATSFNGLLQKNKDILSSRATLWPGLKPKEEMPVPRGSRCCGHLSRAPGRGVPYPACTARNLSHSSCSQAPIQLCYPASVWRPQSGSGLSLGAANRTARGTGSVVTRSPGQRMCTLHSFLVLGWSGLSCPCCRGLLQRSVLHAGTFRSTLACAMD